MIHEVTGLLLLVVVVTVAVHMAKRRGKNYSDDNIVRKHHITGRSLLSTTFPEKGVRAKRCQYTLPPSSPSPPPQEVLHYKLAP